ncbi:hypothetical protein C1Y63_10055 [Corynebacterium sp. 13CS0277]|uniref:carbohydrate-binding domain-containing protein n=1 Tax=Corynebacterium sp. 13CS0277 TaxID=2071994 RepID=UPI000D02797A|nr:carbohydrate-binding domain-containing protein [Corynebacterium sp. 13CS0277]PRQ10711.1 hypothetical protein C1Y63_10055 [Corynebacterium sp. 13CS0277]
MTTPTDTTATPAGTAGATRAAARAAHPAGRARAARTRIRRTALSLAALGAAGSVLAGCQAAEVPVASSDAASSYTATPAGSSSDYAELIPTAGTMPLEAATFPQADSTPEEIPASTTAVTIDHGGSFALQGDYPAGVQVTTTEPVVLVLRDAHLGSADAETAALRVDSTVRLVLEGTSSITAGTPGTTSTAPAAPAVEAAGDLAISGTGALSVTSAGDGVAAAGQLFITDGVLTVTAGGDGLRGAHSVLLAGGEQTVTAQGTGVSATAEDAGLVGITGGKLSVDAQLDAISARDIVVAGGTTDLRAGGGAATTAHTEDTAAGDVAGAPGGGMPDRPGMGEPPAGAPTDMPAPPTGDGAGGPGAGDGSRPVPPPGGFGSLGGPAGGPGGESSGTSATASEESDDGSPKPRGLHASRYVIIDLDADIDVTTSTTRQPANTPASLAVDAADDAINGGFGVRMDSGAVRLAAGDDGVHGERFLLLTGGDLTVEHSTEGLEANQIIATGGTSSVTASDDGWNAQTADTDPLEVTMTIAGGTHTVNAQGDGVDANGSIVMRGGTLLVQGPTGGGDGALDFDDTFTLDGGTLVAVGSTGMVQNPDAGSQSWISVPLAGAKGSTVQVRDSNGEVLAELTAAKEFGAVQASAPGMTADKEYTVTVTTDGTSESATATAGSAQVGR